MNDQPNLRQFLDEVNSFADEPAAAPAAGQSSGALPSIGKVLEIAGSGSQICIDAAQLAKLQSHSDPAVAMSGQVGSQIKVVVGGNWLIANVRTMRANEGGEVVAHVDFLGEGTRDASGKMSSFRRGVTRYPIPSSEVHPVTTDDLRSLRTTNRTSRSAPSIRPMTFAVRSTSTPCCRSISRSWDRPVPVNQPRSR
jgi:hypothetical protein